MALIGKWKLTTNSNDFVGSNNAVDTNVTYAFQCAQYGAGTNKYSTLTTVPGGGTGVHFYTAQVNFTDPITGKYRVIVYAGNTATNAAVYFVVDPAYGRSLHAGAYASGLPTTAGTNYINDGKWHFVSAYYVNVSAKAQSYIYYDGIQVGAGTATNQYNVNAAGNRKGIGGNSGEESFRGYIKNVTYSTDVWTQSKMKTFSAFYKGVF